MIWVIKCLIIKLLRRKINLYSVPNLIQHKTDKSFTQLIPVNWQPNSGACRCGMGSRVRALFTTHPKPHSLYSFPHIHHRFATPWAWALFRRHDFSHPESAPRALGRQKLIEAAHGGVVGSSAAAESAKRGTGSPSGSFVVVAAWSFSSTKTHACCAM